MKAQFLYITDPYCIWCYGFSGVIGKIAADYADRLDIQVINGGMIPTDTPLPAMFGRFPDPMGMHERVTQLSGQEFGADYLNEIRHLQTSKHVLNSTMPARAMIAFQRLGVSNGVAIASEIQRTYYADNKDLQDIQTYEPMAAHFGIDFAAFRQLMDSPDIALGVMDERRMVQEMGIQGFPALLMRLDNGKLALLARGFMPFEDTKTNLDEALRRYASMPEPSGQMCGIDGKGC